MSDIVKLNIKSKGIKAIVSDQLVGGDGFTELPEVLEREKQEQAHKIELENEFMRGIETGRTEASKELEEKHSQELLAQSKDFYNIISTFEDKITEFENSFNQLVIHVSEKIASKIIQKELETDSTINNILNENLRKIIGANDIVIKLNPKDNAILEKSNNEFLASSGINKIRFESNKNIHVGGCLIESEIGNLDARIESQLNELVQALQNNFLKTSAE